MPCNCNCACCSKLLLSTSLTVSGNNLVIGIPSDVPLINLEEYCFIINRCLPTGVTTQQVVLNNGSNQINLLCKLGNYIHADQLKPRKKYHVVYGSNPVHFTITDCVPRTGYVGTN